jgi:hypothetical protein
VISIYCKTFDGSKKVGEFICKANSEEKTEWLLKDECEEDSWIIETKCEKSPNALVYSISNSVVVIEVDDECASKVIEPLMGKYGFENVKWLLSK